MLEDAGGTLTTPQTSSRDVCAVRWREHDADAARQRVRHSQNVRRAREGHVGDGGDTQGSVSLTSSCDKGSRCLPCAVSGVQDEMAPNSTVQLYEPKASASRENTYIAGLRVAIGIPSEPACIPPCLSVSRRSSIVPAECSPDPSAPWCPGRAVLYMHDATGCLREGASLLLSPCLPRTSSRVREEGATSPVVTWGIEGKEPQGTRNGFISEEEVRGSGRRPTEEGRSKFADTSTCKAIWSLLVTAT